MIACIAAAKTYGNRSALTHVTFGSEPGDALCIAGEGGSGKTTLMRLLLGLEHPTSGRVEIDGVDLRALPAPVLQLYRAKVGAIFQEPLLLRGLTIEENLGYPLAVRGIGEDAQRKEIKKMLETLGLGAKGGLLPGELSPSERAMACIGRALIGKPMIVLADEPLAPLDSEQSDIALALLKEAHGRGASLFLFSQGTSLAHRFGAKVLPLKEGRIDAEMPAKPKHAVKKHDEHATEAPKPAPMHASLKAEKEEQEEPEAKAPAKSHAKTHAAPKAKGGAKKIRITQIGS